MIKTPRAFEDFQPGDVIDLGSRQVTKAEIIGFARRFDPQPMHVDEKAAAQTLLGGLAASGWHTAAMMMRLLCDGLLNQSTALGAPGIDRLAWRKPVRAGDVLSATAEVLATRRSKTRPGTGIVQFRFTVLDGKGESVMVMENPIFFATRDRDGAAA